MSKTFKIKRSFVMGLASWLNSLQLNGRESRERSRFVTFLSEEVRTLEKERKEILERYVEKETDENGKEKWKTVDNSEDGQVRFAIPDDKRADFDAEILELYNEDFVLDVGEGHKAKIKAVRDIVLNTDYKFGPARDDSPEMAMAKIREANDYDVWCEAFEALGDLRDED